MDSSIYGKGKAATGIAPAIILVNPKFPHNVGAAVRAASCFGILQVNRQEVRIVTRQSKYTKERLEEAARASKNMAEVLVYLGLKPVGGNFRHIAEHLARHQISTTHFESRRAWAKGQTKQTNESVAKGANKRTLPHEKVFVENAPHSNKLGKRLVDELGWEYKCSICGLCDWLGNAITLHVDHINGVGNDNRLDNLRFLCPNCHQQTETWGYKGCSKFRESQVSHCLDCGTQIHRKSWRCKTCAGKKRLPRTDWPDAATLAAMVTEKSYSAVAKELGVADNAIRKHLKKCGYKTSKREGICLPPKL